jgi:hypothetical protein
MRMYCVKCKKKFDASSTKKVRKSGRNFAVAKHSCGTTCYRITG